MDYFTFEIEGRPTGYYQEHDADGVLFAKASFLADGLVQEKAFWVRYQNVRVLAYRFGSGEWFAFDHGPDVFPTAALPLLVRSMADEAEVRYRRFDEESQALLGGVATLVRRGDTIREFIDGRPARHVLLRDGCIVEYGWGGAAVSRRVASREDAVRGTRFESG